MVSYRLKMKYNIWKYLISVGLILAALIVAFSRFIYICLFVCLFVFVLLFLLVY